MQKPVYAIIVLVLLLILGGIVLMSRRSTSTLSTVTPSDDITTATSDLPSPEASASSTDASTTPPAASVTTVTHTESGFSPSTITIKAGQTVQFVNNAPLAMWVASDPHPAHTKFKEFDAKRGYKPGETYSFTFTQPGTYPYHDHYDAVNHVGTIVVE